ncbi:PPE family protein [Mycobacterium eburneum]|nr:PPE family protein [Mycobacterium eburneum]TDH47509.1 PPE family protein [Mycobacterium eburneum]
MDFGALPPEINSGRMYAGPGPGPLLGAAAAWEALAAELASTASAYDSVISGLTGGAWSGPSSVSMAAAAAPYVSWMSTTAAQAEQTAAGATAAAAAYEAAFAATVPPPVIAANRSLLASLIATNILGQNTPAIAATEAHYIEMWAQDAAAMYAYAGSSAAAAQVTPFNEPPQTTNPAGGTSQAAAVAQATATSAGGHAQALPQLLSTVPQSLQSLASPITTTAAPAAAADPPSLLSALNSFITGPLSPASLFPIGGVPYLLGIQSYLLPQASANLTSAAEKVSTLPAAAVGEPLAGILGMGPATASSTGFSELSAGLGGAGRIAGMSVPSSWASSAPAIKAAAAMLPETNLSAAPLAFAEEGQSSMLSNMALSGLAGRGMVGTGGSAARTVGAASASAGKEFATTANIFVIHEAE